MHKLFLLPILLVGCPSATDTSTDTSTSDTGVPTNDFCGVRTIFNDKCTACHDAVGQQGGLDLESDPFAAIVSVASSSYGGRTLVVPGDATSSFLYLKLTDGQGADGSAMPTGGILPSSLTDVVKTWINNGASSVCDQVDTGSGNYHPSGWAEPGAHGLAAKFQSDACASCHGADLSGGTAGIGCDDCHTSGWKTNCTFCHGGTNGDTSGAPPEDLDDSTTSLTFAEHHVHTEDTALHDAFACTQCHATHKTAVEASHFLDTTDTAPGTAELVFTKGLSANGAYSSGSCSNLYCHGDGTGDNGSMTTGDSISGCNDCHSTSRLNGHHAKHLDEGLGCADCHGGTASSNSKIKDPTLHVNGTVDLALPKGITYAGGKCDGDCHGEGHNNRTW